MTNCQLGIKNSLVCHPDPSTDGEGSTQTSLLVKFSCADSSLSLRMTTY